MVVETAEGGKFSIFRKINSKCEITASELSYLFQLCTQNDNKRKNSEERVQKKAKEQSKKGKKCAKNLIKKNGN